MMGSGYRDEFEESFRRMVMEARRTEERLARALKEFEHAERCIVPLYELRRSTNGYVLTVDMPGVEKEEVGLTLQETSLLIMAPCKSSIERKKRGGKELNYIIDVSLPSDVDTKMVKATMKKGLLRLEMKKRTGGYRIRVE